MNVDLYLGGNDLLITNLTGHPTICLPAGHQKSGDGVRPYSVTFTGRLFGETELLPLRKPIRTRPATTSNART